MSEFWNALVSANEIAAVLCEAAQAGHSVYQLFKYPDGKVRRAPFYSSTRFPGKGVTFVGVEIVHVKRSPTVTHGNTEGR